ncbi:C-type lectin lectoxin-Thr1-like [Erythrolamprus reginae]|uniref:C-type lectin lectoxin-Thr1-like n=1 Tax=Erythrolamprus reginae TaxID=121349 RepID=UPI00396C77C5
MERFIFLTLDLLVMAFYINGAKGCCCPQEWFPRNGVCYKVFDDYKTWADAKTFCREHRTGCHLASIHSVEESTALAEYVTNYLRSGGNVWIGLHDPDKNRNWQWTDKSNYSFRTWKPGEPNNKRYNENCVELWKSLGYKKWNDEHCASRRPFLCQCRLYYKLSPSCCRGKKAPGGA